VTSALANQSTAAPLVAADPARVAAADRVIARLGLTARTGAGGFQVLDPADGRAVATVPDLDGDAAVDSVMRAAHAGNAWARRTRRERAAVLHSWFELLAENAGDLALVITREMGKRLEESRAEIAYGCDFVRWYAEEAVRPRGDMRQLPGGGGDLFVRRGPVGLSVLITPWNFPLAMATRKIAPALAAGCPVVIKPSELTPLTTMLAVTLAHEAGVPPGLIGVVTTTDAPTFSQRVLRDPRVRKVSFTGSTEVGRALLRLAADNVLRSSMELGGNAPFIVFDDADLERAVDGAMAAKLRNGGQSCIAANRFYVQEGIAEAFIDAFTEKMAGLTVGSGFADAVDLGPLINPRAVARCDRLVADAADRGAVVRCGGATIPSDGYFFQPTVLDHVPGDAAVAQTEIFGPIAAIQRFDTEQEVVARANDTNHGLAGYVYTERLDRAFNVADALETGLVGINQGVPSNAAAPFGGLKQSGLGREGSSEGIEEYQEVRYYNLARRATY
jgi:succinate-semialdehyde dehydrogenase/glutarate-semialdehyde dehydrogenase